MLARSSQCLWTVFFFVGLWASVSLGASFDPAVASFDVLRVSAHSNPCCISAASQTLDCYFRGSSSNVHHLIKDNDGERDVEDLGGIIKEDIECVNTDMGMVLLAIDPNNALIWTRETSGNWTEWASLGQSLQEVPSCVVRGQRIDCMGRGTDGEARTIAFEDDQWGEWTDIKGILASPPGCTVDADDVVHCFSADAVNTPQVVNANEQGWGEWRKLDDFPKVKGRPTVFTLADGNATSGFLDFLQNGVLVNEFGGGEVPSGAAKAPGQCLTWGMGEMVCFGVGQDDSHLYRLGDEDWVNSWFAFGFVGTPSCATTNEGEITCCTRGISNGLLEVVYRYNSSGLTTSVKK